MPDAETLTMMLNCGWSLRDIAAHYGVEVSEVERAIVENVRENRENGTL
jgi:hypothetical protein